MEGLAAIHRSTAIYRLPMAPSPPPKSQIPDIKIDNNKEFWDYIIRKKIRRTDLLICLQDFLIFEWFPRSPGLYHTEEGSRSREKAKSFIISKGPDYVLYSRDGKTSMLQGGIGNVRLAPIDLREGEYNFVSASSSPDCCQGVAVAIPVDLYNTIIEEITLKGAVTRSLYGRLAIIPNDLSEVYDGLSVPKIYFKVFDLKASTKKVRSSQLNVNVAVSFIGKQENESRIYATYSNFNPSKKSALGESVKWMKDFYVEKLHYGRIITDFDQIISHFDDAPFSLARVMNLHLDERSLKNLGMSWSFIAGLMTMQKNLVVNIQHMENNKYKVENSNIAALGDHAQAKDFSQQITTSNDIDLPNLANELAKLRAAAKAEATLDEHDEAIGNLASAEKAAKSGDKSKTMQFLATTGKWTLEMATKVGVPLAVAALKESLNLPK